MSDRALREHDIVAWLCVGPLLAVAETWQVALTLAACLLATITLSVGGLALVRRVSQSTAYLPLAVLMAGTLAVFEQLALAAWWPSLHAEVAPWLVLVAGLAVLVSCVDGGDPAAQTSRPFLSAVPGTGFRPIPGRNDELSRIALAMKLSIALLLIGLARDGFGRVFLLAKTPVGVLVLLALLLAAFNFVRRDFESSSQPAALSSMDSGLRRNDGQP